MSASREGKKKLSKKALILILAAAVVLIAAGVIAGLSWSRYMAATMRVLRMEGTVRLTQEGREKTLRDNLRLQDGDGLETEEKSLVSVGLDETKIVTLQAESLAEVQKKAKWLRLQLREGTVFFQVTKALDPDETFDITTSDMVVGIRGTSGYVSVAADGTESMAVTDGHVRVTGTNPVTGEVL